MQDLIFAVALRFKDYTFNSSGHRFENCSSRYSFMVANIIGEILYKHYLQHSFKNFVKPYLIDKSII